jgi:hypothetical protein
MPELNEKQVVNVEYVKNYFPPPPPIHFQYTQYAESASNDFNIAFPEHSRPESLWPNTKWKTLWEDEFIFFRTGGSQSLLMLTQRVDGYQQEDFKSHTHSSYSYIWHHGPWDGNTPIDGSVFDNDATVYSSNIGYSGGSETRPNNRLMIIWQRYE